MMKNRLTAIYHHRFFLFSVVSKEFRVRYTQSILGTGWLVIEPLIFVCTLATIFTLIGRSGPGGAPFAVFFYCGVLPWQIFASSLTAGSRCFSADQNFIRKLNYPKEITVVKNLIVFVIDFLFASIAYIAVLIFYQYAPNWNYFYIPLLLLIILFLGASMMFLLGTLQVFIRDIGILAKSLTQIWFWFSPIIFMYPYEGMTKPLYYINPMAGVIHSFHRIILFDQPPMLEQLYSSFAWIAVVFSIGYIVFRKYEKGFIDVI